MVSKFISGKSVKGALNYNENKVSEGKARLLHAENYLFGVPELSFHDKLSTLQNLTDRNERAKTNCVHITLNFDPADTINDNTMTAIAKTYMDKIGFGEQPYLVYRHTDVAHPHVHIVSTNIRYDGTRIASQNIGKNQSEKARKEIEKTFGLVAAESRKKEESESVKPVAKKIIYGKSETKSAVSNVVRSVVKEYKYTSLAELNAALGQYNVTAYRGEEGSKMFERKGLSYCVLDSKGNRIGVPIKASSIYTKPTLANLEKKFAENKSQKTPYREQLKSIIDKTLASFIPDKKSLKNELAKKNIVVVFRQNETMVYGITFIDNNNKTVFNGSALGKEYTAKRILERIGIEGILQRNEQNKNKEFVEKVFKETDYSKGIAVSLATLYSKGLRVNIAEDVNGETEFSLGHYHTNETNYTPANKKITAWLWNNNITPNVIGELNKEFDNANCKNLSDTHFINRVTDFIKDVLANEAYMQAQIFSPDPKKKKRRKPNW